MSGCDWERELHAYHDGELSPGDAERVERHIRQCAVCAGELRRIEGISGMLRRADRPVLSRDGVGRVRQVVGTPYRDVLRLCRRVTVAAAGVLVGAAGVLFYRANSRLPSGNEARGGVVFVWERAAVARRPVARSGAGEQVQLAQWIVNDLARPARNDPVTP